VVVVGRTYHTIFGKTYQSKYWWWELLSRDKVLGGLVSQYLGDYAVVHEGETDFYRPPIHTSTSASASSGGWVATTEDLLSLSLSLGKPTLKSESCNRAGVVGGAQ
jgi:hypothetical protein